MSPESTHPESPNGERAFVQQALADADRSERTSQIVVGVLALIAIITFFWMHLHLFAPATLWDVLHSILRVDLFFLVLMFALTFYLRQQMNKNTRILLRALANTRGR
jgi:uncharacterized membrane-anchored protein